MILPVVAMKTKVVNNHEDHKSPKDRLVPFQMAELHGFCSSK